MIENTLPRPDEHASRQTELVKNMISKEIFEKGPIPFQHYMQLALYAPGLGYYVAGREKLGKAGDFVTAPEISPLYSRCLAKQCEEILTHYEHPVIFEFGAGSGIMALTLLTELAKFNALPERYDILEVSPELTNRQQELFSREAPELLGIVCWVKSLPDVPLTGIILANEVLDAMPVHKFVMDDGVKEFYVDWDGCDFQWLVDTPSSPRLVKAVNQLDMTLADCYQSEINLFIDGWIASLGDMLEAGVIFIVDYGFPEHEYYHPDRTMGTLMCHYRHYAHDDPFYYPGIQDITAHVDFTAVALAARKHGLTVKGFVNQAGFLIQCGITDLVADVENPVEHYAVTQQIKRLTLPSEMGELFKVMALTKNYSDSLLGFRQYNRVECL